jgi:uncharacterized protein YdbL (DUF1318 family)
MTRSPTRVVAALAVASTFAACITVNIYFPAPEVRAAAERIVDETWGGMPADNGATPAKGGSSMLRWLLPREAVAAETPDVNVQTAAIRTLKASMKARAGKLRPYLASGNVGIGKNGMLVVRKLDGVGLRDQAELRRLVDAENKDRADLYRQIAEANNYPKDRIADIQKIFAETWIQKAERGWPIQKADGSWTTK